ncbi:MAG: 5-(carboxyamino)imidazole ribonucleotide synthase [Dehalococcoidia bacterium]|jgi:5-(carboxyamino)imidazole ribonucleotide synthase|nr:5-(carboxyamino)imidazole ribonucleotide synthase [Dehalococcoidia bacterium]
MTSTPTVGIVGAGQLARMMIEAATPLDIPIRLLAASPTDGAARIWPHVDIGLPKSTEDLHRFAQTCDVITFDHELVNLDAIRELEAAGKLVYPSSNSLLHAQDKLHQRTAFEALGLPIPPYRAVVTTEDITAFAADHGWPVVAKAQRDGYDGRGVWVLDGPDDAAQLTADAATNGVKLLAERFVPIQQELAGLIARRPGGEFVTYPIVETVQRNGICHEVLVPAPVSEPIRRRAEELTVAVAEATGVVGIMALELFLADGELLINEIATRPHNSGHFSIEATATSQFENHLRAVIDWPLGSTRLRSPAAVMANLLGRGQNDVSPGVRSALTADDSEVHIHLYGKESRDGRKIGHVTALGDDLDQTRRRATKAAEELMVTTA